MEYDFSLGVIIAPSAASTIQNGQSIKLEIETKLNFLSTVTEPVISSFSAKMTDGLYPLLTFISAGNDKFSYVVPSTVILALLALGLDTVMFAFVPLKIVAQDDKKNQNR